MKRNKTNQRQAVRRARPALFELPGRPKAGTLITPEWQNETDD